jgi:hypothetical protein
MFPPIMAKKKADWPPSPNILDYPSGVSEYERESLAAEAKTCRREENKEAS